MARTPKRPGRPKPAEDRPSKPKTREDALRELVEKDPEQAARLLRDILGKL